MSRQRGREKFYKYKPLILILSKFFMIFPKKMRIILLERHRMTKGYLGLVIRYALLQSIAIECGDNISIHPGVYLLCPERIKIGNNVSIHPMCYLDATGDIVIGNDVSIAHGVTIMSTSHNYSDLKIPIKDQFITKAKTVIRDDVWIGSKSTILAGRVVNEGAIVGANSVVTKDVPSKWICAGIPARALKMRGEDK